MKANASAGRTCSEKEIEKEQGIMERAIKYLEEANRVDNEEDRKFGPDKRGNELPEEISRKEVRVKRIREEVKKLKEAKEKLKSGDKEKINLTDNDAEFQKDKGRIIAGYRGELAVDSDNQVIVANDVTNEQNDAPCLMPMVEQVLENATLIQGTRVEKPIKVSADAGYSSGRNLSELEKKKYRDKIDPYIPA